VASFFRDLLYCVHQYEGFINWTFNSSSLTI
jgi:hypothetical protein